MGIGCGAFNLNKIGCNKALNNIGQIFKDHAIGDSRYHLSPLDALTTGVDKLNPVGFIASGGQGGAIGGGNLMSALTAGTATPGQQSFGRMFSKIPKTFGF